MRGGAVTKFYLDLPCIAEVPAAYRVDSAGLMDLSGANLGNFAFRHALRFLVADFDAYRPERYIAYHAAAGRGEVTGAIVSCANWLGTSAQDEAANRNRARAFAATDTPTVCFGLGVQARAGEVPELGPETRRLAEVLAERAALLSVRDTLTQRTLERIGITNTVVTGCPSNFINPDRDLGARIRARARALRAGLGADGGGNDGGSAGGNDGGDWRRVRSLVCEFSGGHAASGKVLADTLRLMAHSPAFLVLQSPELLAFVLRETDALPPPYLAANPFAPDEDRLRQVLRACALHFASVEGWMDFARTCDIAFGMRIHGTMLPLQAGVPAMLVSHDARTAGLGAHMAIPQVSAQDFAALSRAGPGALLEAIDTAMAGYDARRAELARVMCDYLRTNGLAPHAAVAALAAPAQGADAPPVAG